jgi:hypothetical protein
MKLEMIKSVITRNAGRGCLIIRKYSPEILMAAGVVGIVTSTVMACKATLKVDEVLDDTKGKLDRIKTAHATVSEEKYSEQDYKKDLVTTYTQSGIGFIKLYGPAVTLGLVSIGCMLGAHGIMRKRNLALMAAYKTVEQSFADYRKRVVAELGEEKDRQFKYGIKKDSYVDVIKDENGNEIDRVRKEIDVMDTNGISQYARYFDESCLQWSPTPEYNRMFLKCQQNIANDILHSRGHLFLNEVYEMLGIKHSKDGSIVGWVLGSGGDDFVDFGIFDVDVAQYEDDHANDTIGEKRRDFVNGFRSKVLLDFNVDGIIWDKI